MSLRRRHAAVVTRPRATRLLRADAPAPVEIGVRESPRARRGRVVVHPSGRVEVVVPVGTRGSAVDRLIASHLDWIVDRSARARAERARTPRLHLVRPGALPLQGAWAPVERRPGGRPLAALDGDRLVVRGPEAEATAATLRWYRRHARAVTADAVRRESGRLGLAAGALSVRDQRTRWGSCSRRGDLSFSWRLVLAPPEVLDYVVVHELCHLVRHDHSPAFWQLVERALPDWRDRAAWLRTHGDELLAFAPSFEAHPGHVVGPPSEDGGPTS